MFSGNKELVFGDRSIDVKIRSGENIGLSSLSSGEKHLIRILVQTLLASKSTIFIDEPELSMHVDWQRSLLEYMRILNPDSQFVLATHSPEIMANISDNKIFSL
jgi:predicted ATPase